MHKKNTDDLKQEIEQVADLQRFLKENEDNFISGDVATHLAKIYEKSPISKAKLAKNAYISEVYLHQLFSGKRNPSRDRILCVLIAMEASLEDIQELLHHCGFGQLYAHNRRDAIIMYGIVHNLSLIRINDTLFKEELDSLF